MRARTGAILTVAFLGGAGSLLNGQDALIVPDASGPVGGSVLLPLSVGGPSSVVEMQFDVRFVKSAFDVLGPIATGDSNHRVMSREVSAGLRRIVVFSRSNALLSKNVVLDLPLVMSATATGQPPALLRIEGLCFALEDGTKITPAIQHGPIASWYFAHFTAEELEIPAIYGDNRDPDFDGLPNLVEYGVGGSPVFRDSHLQPTTSFDPGPAGEGLWTMTYWESKSAEGVVVEPQLSSDLVDWIELTAVPTGVEDEFAIEMEVTVDAAGLPRQFIRLSVRRTE